MEHIFDVVVIGSGTAGSAVASRCRFAGWSVAVIDSLPFGGTCALRGCDPKKVLVGAAELLDFSERLHEKQSPWLSLHPGAVILPVAEAHQLARKVWSMPFLASLLKLSAETK
jgi:2-polyprenyl-6-methoxyphenol hydroxylase-like FAD-dependent oxidoreductase